MSQLHPYLLNEEIYHIPAPVMVIVPRAWHKFLEDEKALLTKILGSVKISIDSVAIVERESISLKAMHALNPGKVLIFGVPVEEGIKDYEYTKLGSFPVIRADDLSQLDDARKKSLWIGLKQMFGV